MQQEQSFTEFRVTTWFNALMTCELNVAHSSDSFILLATYSIAYPPPV